MPQLLWTQKQDIGPAARSRFDMVYDPSRTRVMLFGGQTGTVGTNDTWEWNGQEWTQTADIGPSPRFGHALACDSNRNRIVLFGGGTGQSVLGDTWEWDGEYWTQIADTGPTARAGHAMCFDTKRQRVMLFGGMNLANATFADTWAWDGNEWTQEQDTGPSARCGHKVVYDSMRDRLTLFGGRNITTYTYSVKTSNGNWWTGSGATYQTETGYENNYFNDTWEFDAAQWTRVADTGPNPRSAYGMVYNSNEVLLFGGQGSSGVYGDTWAWDGKYWTQRQDIGPAARSLLGMAYDSARQRAVLFGGANPTQFADTWEQSERPEPSSKMPKDETNSVDLEGAWAHYGTKLRESFAQMSPAEARVFGAIIRAAAQEVNSADQPAQLPPDLTENNQPQRDGISLLLSDAIAHFPDVVLGIGPAGGTLPEVSGGNLVNALAQKLTAVPTDEAEREISQILLGLAASNLVRSSGRLSAGTAELQVFAVAMEGLRLLQPHCERIPSDGKVWRGRPAFITRDGLAKLQAEAAEARQRAIELKWRALAHAGHVATQLAQSPPLLDLVQTHVGKCAPTGRAAYVYYDAPGQGLYPHVDTSNYALTALFVVRHVYRGAPQSAHLHYSADGRAERVDLEAGEMLLFFGGTVVHARTPVARDESVVVLTIGFRLL